MVDNASILRRLELRPMMMLAPPPEYGLWLQTAEWTGEWHPGRFPSNMVAIWYATEILGLAPNQYEVKPV